MHTSNELSGTKQAPECKFEKPSEVQVVENEVVF